jgi:uncharacterized membrane protein
MVSLSDARILGGIGSILIVLTVVPNIGWLFGIAGFVMVLLAVSNISKAVNDRAMYKDMLTALVIAVGAIAVAAITVVGVAYQAFGTSFFAAHSPATSVFGGNATSAWHSGVGPFSLSHFAPAALNYVVPANWLVLALTALGGILVAWALFVVSAVFVRRSYNAMAARLGVERFRTAGLLFLIGAGTAVIGVGLVLIFIAEILFAISYFSLPDRAGAAPQPGTVQAPALG